MICIKYRNPYKLCIYSLNIFSLLLPYPTVIQSPTYQYNYKYKVHVTTSIYPILNLHTTYRFPAIRVPGPLVSPTTLQVRADSLAGTVSKLRKLPGTSINNGLDFFFGLLTDGHHAV